MKIDHNKHTIVEAFGLDNNLAKKIAISIVEKITNDSGNCQDSAIYEYAYNNIKNNEMIPIEESDRELSLFVSGILTALSLSKFKNENPPIELDSNPLKQLKSLFESVVGKGRMVLGGNVPPEIQSLISKLSEDAGIETVINTSGTDDEEIFKDRSRVSLPNMSKNPFPSMDPDQIEAHMIKNIDSFSDEMIGYFVTVIKNCEETCPYEKKLTCPIYKRYESME